MKKELIKKINECAKMYEKNLNRKNFMFIFENKKSRKIELIETAFLSHNFMHLTGTKFKTIKAANEFYRLCLKNELSYKEIIQKQNGTTKLKLEVLPQLMNIGKNAKIIANYDSSKVNLYTEKIIGTVHCCMGFIKKGEYYLPNTIIKQDIRKISNENTIGRIMGILQKAIDQKQYKDITYIKKDFNLYEIIKAPNTKGKISPEVIFKACDERDKVV